jgi:hypothetical protein
MSSVNTAALTELNAALGRQIANVLKQAGFYARLVRNIGAAKTEGVPRAGHIGARDGSAKGQTQHQAEQRCAFADICHHTVCWSPVVLLTG